MNKTILPFLIILFLCSNSGIAQRIKIDKEALSFLTLAKKINVEFSYDGLMIDNDVPETQFLKRMHAKIIDHRDEQEANQWALNYEEFKSNIWADSFISELNNRLSKAKNAPIFLNGDSSVKYTMKVNIPWMYFGYDAGIVNEPAKVTMHLDFIETANPDSVLFSTEIRRAMGKYNRTEGDGEGAGASLNRMRKALQFGAYKLAQSLKRILD